MGIYLVDYENVHNDGVANIKTLTPNDRVVIFYGDSIKSIPFDTHVEMMQSPAQIEYIETHKIAKNYLDFQLSTYLGYLIGKGEKGPVYVISQDTGFDSIVDFWTDRGLVACRQPSILTTAAPVKEPVIKKKKKKNKKNEAPAKTDAPKESSPSETAAGKGKHKLPEAVRKKVRAALKEEKLPAGKYTTIYKALEECPNKLALNNSLVKAFDNTEGSVIYNHIKKIYEDYRQQ